MPDLYLNHYVVSHKILKYFCETESDANNKTQPQLPTLIALKNLTVVTSYQRATGPYNLVIIIATRPECGQFMLLNIPNIFFPLYVYYLILYFSINYTSAS